MAPLAALLVGEITHIKDEWAKLSDRVLLMARDKILELDENKELINPQEYSQGSREDFLGRCSSGEFDGVKVISRSNASTSVLLQKTCNSAEITKSDSL